MAPCFRFEACAVCARCGKRPGVVCGLQGFGVRLKGHDARCAQRLQGRSPELPGSDSIRQTDNFVSAASRLPQDSQIRPSVATTAWASAQSRPSTQTNITRESSISRASTQTPNTRLSTATSKQSDVFDEKYSAALVDVPRLQQLIRVALDKALASGELLGVLHAESEIAHVQIKLREALDEALSSGKLAVSLGIGDVGRKKQLDQGVLWPPSAGQDGVVDFRECGGSDSFRSTTSEPQEEMEKLAPESVADQKQQVEELEKITKQMRDQKEQEQIEKRNLRLRLEAEAGQNQAHEVQEVSSTGKGDVVKLSQEEHSEAVLIYELCDKEGQDNAALENLVDVAVKHEDVARFLGFPAAEQLTVESVREQILAKVGRVKRFTWQTFELFVSEQRANMAEKSSPLPRLSAEKEIDLIFAMCDADNNGHINFAEFAAFCVKHPRVAEVVGMRDNQKRPQADVLFAQLSDGRGSITRKELRNFVWQRRGGANEPEESRSENPSEREHSPVPEPVGKSKSRKGKRKPKAQSAA